MDPIRKQALDSLLGGKNARQTALDLGINPSTVGRWIKNDPDFKEALNQREAQDAREGLDRLVPNALKTLEDALSGRKTIPQAKATLALNIIKAAAQIGKAEDGGAGSGLAKRLAEIDSGNNGRLDANDSALPD